MIAFDHVGKILQAFDRPAVTRPIMPQIGTNHRQSITISSNNIIGQASNGYATGWLSHPCHAADMRTRFL
jgi:hypothetical protein